MTRQKMGPSPCNKDKHDQWIKVCDRLRKKDVPELNKMIEKFNLIVPNMNNQKFLFKLDTESEKIFNSGYEANNSLNQIENELDKKDKAKDNTKEPNIFDTILSMFK